MYLIGLLTQQNLKLQKKNDVLRTTQRLPTLAALLKHSRSIELLFMQDKRNSIKTMRDAVER